MRALEKLTHYRFFTSARAVSDPQILSQVPAGYRDFLQEVGGGGFDFGVWYVNGSASSRHYFGLVQDKAWDGHFVFGVIPDGGTLQMNWNTGGIMDEKDGQARNGWDNLATYLDYELAQDQEYRERVGDE
jgi:hypothetical protein